MFLWLNWFWDGGRGAFWEPSLGKAALGGRPCFCGEEYMTSDGWLAGPLENLAPPFWCAEEAESNRTTTNKQAHKKYLAKPLLLDIHINSY